MSFNKLSNQKEELLLSVLEFLDRNGYKQSFEKLQQKTGIHYQDNDKKLIEDLLRLRKIDELIIYINNNSKITSEEKIHFIKILKIKKYIELVLKNCSDRIDQKDSLYYLRTEISPMINNSTSNNILINSLTKILFFKDMNLLKEYIQKNLSDYRDDSQIINQITKNRIIQIEQLFDTYNKSLDTQKEISFKKYNNYSFNNLCYEPFKTSEIWFLEVSKNKKYLALGFSNANLSLFLVSNKNNKLILNLIMTISANENTKKGEISSICFSPDEKYLLVSLTNNFIRIYNCATGEKFKEYTNLHTADITSCTYISPNGNKFLSGSIDKRLLLIDNNNPSENSYLEIGKFFRIKQIIYSENNNLIIIFPASMNDIICFDLPKNKVSFKIEIKEEFVYGNISKSDKGKYILINISKEHPKILLYNLDKKKTEEKYHGHVQKYMVIKCAFGGEKDQYILSGSEDANICLWEKKSPGRPKYILRGHIGIVNSIEFLFNDVIISASDDKTIKIWTPIADEKCNQKEVNVEKNEKNVYIFEEVDFDKEFLEKMNEPIDNEMNIEDENEEDSEEEEDRGGDIREEADDD